MPEHPRPVPCSWKQHWFIEWKPPTLIKCPNTLSTNFKKSISTTKYPLYNVLPVWYFSVETQFPLYGGYNHGGLFVGVFERVFFRHGFLNQKQLHSKHQHWAKRNSNHTIWKICNIRPRFLTHQIQTPKNDKNGFPNLTKLMHQL